jgi:hypothetical protein
MILLRLLITDMMLPIFAIVLLYVPFSMSSFSKTQLQLSSTTTSNVTNKLTHTLDSFANNSMLNVNTIFTNLHYKKENFSDTSVDRSLEIRINQSKYFYAKPKVLMSPKNGWIEAEEGEEHHTMWDTVTPKGEFGKFEITISLPL